MRLAMKRNLDLLLAFYRLYAFGRAAIKSDKEGQKKDISLSRKACQLMLVSSPLRERD